MVKIILILLIPAMALGQVTLGQGKALDEILAKTGKIRTEGVKGFIFHHGATVQVSPTTDTSNIAKSMPNPVSMPSPVYGQFVPYQSYLKDITELNNKINALQIDYATTSTKMTTILDNMATNAGTQKDSLDMLTKFIEALSALLAALGSAAALWQVFKKKKKT